MYVCIHIVQSIHEHMAIVIGMSKKAQWEQEARTQTYTPATSDIRPAPNHHRSALRADTREGSV